LKRNLSDAASDHEKGIVIERKGEEEIGSCDGCDDNTALSVASKPTIIFFFLKLSYFFSLLFPMSMVHFVCVILNE